MKNELLSLRNRPNQIDKRINDIKDRNLGMTQMEEERESRVGKNETTLQELTALERKI